MSVAAADLKTVELVVRGTASAEGDDPQAIINLFHYRRLATVVDPVKANIITGFHDSVVTPLCLALNHTYSVQTIGCRFLEDVDDPYLDVVQTDVGAVAGDRLPAKIAVYCLKRTARRGKKNRGGWHFGPISESATGPVPPGAGNGSEVLVDSAYNLFVDVADAVMAGFASSEGNNWVPVLWSKSQSVMTTVPATIEAVDLTQILVRKSLGSMKSRKVASLY